MPLKKDDKGHRWVEMNFIAPGSPEEVWQAMATGAGNTAWFTKTQIEERVGGKLKFDFGPEMSSSGEVTTWEPPLKFGYVEREWEEGAPPVATEIVITTRKGGTCSVRMVHSLFTSKDDWDDQLESFESGWPGFFDVLRIYLEHFAGLKAASFQIMSMVEASHLETWQRFTRQLNLAGASVGERHTLPPELGQLTGVVEKAVQSAQMRTLLLRIDAPWQGLALVGTYDCGGQTRLSTSVFLYGEDADSAAQTNQALWANWMQANFPAGPPA